MNPIRLIDHFLNRYTMYTVTLFGLLMLLVVALFLSGVGLLSFSPLNILFSAGLLGLACFATNQLISRTLAIPVNIESASITALILFFVVSPAQSISEASILFLIGVLSMLSKYLLAWNKKHIFNPAAVVLVLVGILGVPVASWWVANPALAPFVLIFGLLVVRKIRRFSMVSAFLLAASVGIFGIGLSRGAEPLALLFELYASWPVVFFATFMLTEPLTTPPTSRLQILYGLLIGALFGSQFQIWRFYSTPEFALVVGNVFSSLVSPQYRLVLRLKKKTKIATDTYDFAFQSSQKLSFEPGQYMEWTLPHAHPDIRGNRRYFTIASSPTEAEVHLGIRFSTPSSSFKKELLSLQPGAEIVAGQLAGDFVLPAESERPLVFIAGGIGITPFRSMIQFLRDTKQKRTVTLFYVNRHEEDIAYQELFNEANQHLDLQVIYVLTDASAVPKNWSGEVGYIDEKMVRKYIHSCEDCKYYLSGPNTMVESYQELLSSLGVDSGDIVRDYFPGF